MKSRTKNKKKEIGFVIHFRNWQSNFCLAYKRLRVRVVADFGALSYQVTPNMIRGKMLEYATIPAITYTHYYELPFLIL